MPRTCEKWWETYQRTEAYTQTADRADFRGHRAVGCGDNGVRVDDGSTAVVAAADVEGRNEGEFTGRSSSSTDNRVIRLVLGEGVVGVLRGGSTKDERWKHNCGESLETHVEDGERLVKRWKGGETSD